MKLLLDDSIKSYRLNANEACIYACIAKCTRAGKGWYGNYAALADAMPFVMEKTTAYRAVQKLYQLGLIERRDDNHLYALQIATKPLQNAIEPLQIATKSLQNAIEPLQNAIKPLQNATESLQNAIPPITPINNKNMNELKNEERETHVHTHDAHVNPVPSFSNFMDLFRKTGTNVDNDAALHAYNLWQKCTIIKQKAMVSALSDPLGFRKPRPDWFISDFPEPKPIFLSGEDQDKERANGKKLVQVIYNGLYKICTQEMAEEHNLKINKPW